MVKEIKNIKLIKELKNFGLEDILLIKDNGSFYLASDNNVWAYRLANLKSNSIYIYKFSDCSVKEWVKEIVNIFIQDNPNYWESWQVELKNKLDKIQY